MNRELNCMKQIIRKRLNYYKTESNMSIFASFILCLYLSTDLVRLFNVIPLLLGNALYVVLGSVALIYSIYKNGIKKQIPIILFIFIYNFFGAIGVITNGNINFQELLWPFAFIGLATLLLNFDISYKISKYIYISLLICLAINIMISGGVNSLSIISSRNTISIMVLIYFAIYAIACYRNKNKINIYFLIAGFIVVIMAIGRSGILTFSILTVFFLIFDFRGKCHRVRNPIKIFVLLVGVAITAYISLNLAENYFNDMIYNFNRRGLESIRIEIWTEYLNKVFTSAKYFIFGAPIEGAAILDIFPNLHNSWLMLHSKYGIFIFSIIIAMVTKSYIYFLKSRNLLYFTLLTVIMFRMQFDHTNFNAQLDIVFFYLILYPYMSINIHDDKLTPNTNKNANKKRKNLLNFTDNN